jgi:carnitine O-palmitoyltransferase 1
MEEQNSSAEELRALLVQAVETHSTYAKDALTGSGVDRHLFGLYVVSAGKDIDSPFLKKAMSVSWKLSTSQQPHGASFGFEQNRALDGGIG